MQQKYLISFERDYHRPGTHLKFDAGKYYDCDYVEHRDEVMVFSPHSVIRGSTYGNYLVVDESWPTFTLSVEVVPLFTRNQ